MGEIIDFVAFLNKRKEQREREVQQEIENLMEIVDTWIEAMGGVEPKPYYVSIEEQISQNLLTGEE